MADEASLIEVRNVSKRFGAVQALNDVSLHINRGEILGLAGENGAGKSTLFSVMTGVVQADSGMVLKNGLPTKFRGLHEANRGGIYRVYQDQGFMPNLKVYENILLGHEDLFSRAGVVNRRAMEREATRQLEVVGGSAIDVTGYAITLPFRDRQLLGIARAVAGATLREVEQPVILFDEPTTTMAHGELQTFMGLMQELRASGMTLVFVSHRLREILGACDRVYILKDGGVVGERKPEQVTELDMHALMVGRARTDEYYHEGQQGQQPGKVLLELSGAAVDGEFGEVDLQVRANEVLGVGGVTGSGKEVLGRAIAGLAPLTEGRIDLFGRDVTRLSLRARIQRGIGYVPLDRHEEGAVLNHSIAWNMTMSSLSRVTPKIRGIISPAVERRRVDEIIGRLRIATPNAGVAVGRLSGGNQQKVVIGRIILTSARVIVLDNPTRGVDAGAKHEIYGVIRQLAADGAAVVLVTEDLPELIGLSNRIVVMRDGRVQSIEPAPVGGKPTEAKLVADMV